MKKMVLGNQREEKGMVRLFSLFHGNADKKKRKKEKEVPVLEREKLFDLTGNTGKKRPFGLLA